MNRRFLLYDTTLGILRRRLGMLGNDIHTFYQYTLLCPDNTSSTLRGFFRSLSSPAITTTLIAFFNIELWFKSVTHFIYFDTTFWLVLLLINTLFLSGCKDTIYNTSGAREIIFIYPLSRNSLATGPKIRVPRGSSDAFNNTTALSSKRI